MNGAHLHLILVHIPIVLVPTGAFLLACALYRRIDTLKKTAFAVMTAAAIASGGAFLSGESAEEIVEEISGVSERAIEDHEESAEIALWLTLALGGLSAAAFFQAHRVPRGAGFVLLALSLVSSGLLANAAQQGGKIRHPEAFASSASGTGAGEQQIIHEEYKEENDDDE